MKYPPVTEERLERCLAILAYVIDTQGDAAWSLFERLERELEHLRSKRSRTEHHLRRGKELSPPLWSRTSS